MAQHDFQIANAPGATVRSDINSAFNAIATNNSGTSAPSTTYALMWWFDTTNNILKIRDASDANWVNVASLSGTTWVPYSAGQTLSIGTSNGDIPQFDATGYPAADASQLTNLTAANILINGATSISGAVDETADTVNVWDNDVGAVRKVIAQNLIPIASKAEAEAGTNNTKRMTPQRVAEALAVSGLNAEIFTAAGTYTVPAGVTQVLVEAVGGGGGGGGGSGGVNGSGGGSGAKIRAVVTVTPGGNITVTIGSGGSGGGSGSNGSAGGDTTFGSLVTAGGGGGGGSGGGGGGARGSGSTSGTKLEEHGRAGADGSGDRTGGNPEGTGSGEYTGVGLAGDGGASPSSGGAGQSGMLIVRPITDLTT